METSLPTLITPKTHSQHNSPTSLGSSKLCSMKMSKSSKPSKTTISAQCRLCGVDKSCGLSINSFERQNRPRPTSLLSKINKYLPKEVIHIMVNDGFSKFVCSDCEGILNNFANFCNMVKEVQSQYEKERINSKRKLPKLNNDPSDGNIATVNVGPDGLIECKVCKVHLNTIEHTTLHMVTHGIGTVICCCCMCGEKGNLTQFINRSKKSGKNASSVWCYSCSFLETSVQAITKEKMAPTKVHTCEECSKSFYSHAHLLRHKVTHSGSKPFLCEVCGSGFSQRSSLKLHVSSHSGLNPYKCHQCGQTFRFKVSLSSHVLSMHTPEVVSERKVYSCNRCGKHLATKYKLHRHYRSHTGERPYECPRCSRLFSQTSNLNQHLKKHFEEDVGTIQQSEPYTHQVLTKHPNSVPYVAQADHNLLNDSGPKFLESIFQDRSAVSCDDLETSRNPQTTMDAALLNSSTKSSHESHYGSISTDFVTNTNHLTSSDYIGVPIPNSNVKTISHKRSLEVFTNYSKNKLFIDESANLQDATSNSEGISLPTFSSLQTGSSTSSLPHSHSTL